MTYPHAVPTDDELLPLTIEIHNRFETLWFDEIGGVSVSTMPKAMWQDFFPDAGRFGWCWPIEQENAGTRYLIGYSPEMIAATIIHLDAEDRENYLNAVEHLWTSDIVHDEPDARKRHATVLSFFEEHFPASAVLIREVEAHAMATGIVKPVASDACSCGFVNEEDATTCVLCNGRLGA